MGKIIGIIWGYLFGFFKSSLKDDFRALLKNNVGQIVEIYYTKEIHKGTIVKVGVDYLALSLDGKQWFIPLLQIKAIRLVDS